MSDSEVFEYKKTEEDLRKRWEESVKKCGTVEGVNQLHCEKSVVAVAEGSKLLEEKLASSQEEAEKKCESALSGIVINGM